MIHKATTTGLTRLEYDVTVQRGDDLVEQRLPVNRVIPGFGFGRR